MHDSYELWIWRYAPCSQLEGMTNAAQVRCLGRFCVEIRIWDLLNTKQQELFSKPILMLFYIFALTVFSCQFWHHACYKHKNPLAVTVSNKWFILCLYTMSQEEWTKLRESVPYVELYRYNPKHLHKLIGYGDNGHRKVWASEVSTYCTPSVTPWVSYILFIIIIGGILLLFMYIKIK